jgi:hypothetical protein
METIIGFASAVVGGVLALHVFYRAVQTKWPESYMSATDFTGLLVSRSIARYVAYRALPVFAVAFFVAGSLKNAGHEEVWPTLTMALIHAGMTNGRGLWQTLGKRRKTFGATSTALFHCTALMGTVASAIGAIATAQSERARDFLPAVDEISTALWTGAIAAVLGAYLLKVSSAAPPDPFTTSRRSIPDTLWASARTHALANGTDPALVKAIMLVENLQRPRWVRRLENLKRRLGLPGTYGIMQVASPDVTDDESSVRLACEGHLKGARPTRTSYGGIDYESLRLLVSRHNPDPDFIEYVQQVYWQVAQEESDH